MLVGDNGRVDDAISVLRGAGHSGGPMSTTRMVEASFVVVLGALRAGFLVQLGVSASFLLREDGVHAAVWTTMALAYAASVALFVTAIRRGTFRDVPVWLGALDIAVALAALAVSGAVMPAEWQIGSWLVWAPAFASPVAATVPAWLRNPWVAVGVGGGLIGAVYAASIAPGNRHQLLAVIENGTSYVLFAAMAAFLLIVMRRLARVSDANRVEAARLAGELEAARYRAHVHDAAGLLAHLARDDTPADLRPALQEQAVHASNRLRNEILNPLAPASPSGTAPRVRLDEVVASAIAGFSHLPLEVRTALARDVTLSRETAAVLEPALVSLLYNVQYHAKASEVVVHADADADTWEVSVSDDGIGFDLLATPRRFGLQEQVLGAAHGQGLSVDIASAPGEGTLVTISGRRG